LPTKEPNVQVSDTTKAHQIPGAWLKIITTVECLENAHENAVQL